MKDTCQPKWHKVCDSLAKMQHLRKSISDSAISQLLNPMRKMEWFGDEMEAYCDKLLSIFQKTKSEVEMVEIARKYLHSV